MLFKQPNIRKFHYIPRYYDPKKEAKERRMKRAEGIELTDDERREEFRQRLHTQFSQQTAETRQSGRIFGNQMTRFFLIVVTMLIAGLFIYAKYGDAIINMFIDY